MYVCIYVCMYVCMYVCTVVIKRKFPYFTVFNAYFTVLSTIREKKPRANVALTLQQYFHVPSNAMYGILGVVINLKVTREK